MREHKSPKNTKYFTVEEIVNELYLGILNREPDDSGFKHYVGKIMEGTLISKIIHEILNSREFQKKQVEYLIKQIYQGMLNREADPGRLNTYTEMMLNGKELKDVIQAIKNSQEFFMRQHDTTHHMLKGSHIAYAYNNPAVVFIHIPKTAGQSLHYLFKTKYGENRVSPLFNNLCFLPANFVYSYDVIFGHTDYETVKLLVRRKKVYLVTYLRDPVKRLISLYKFWWSHKPEFHKNFAVQVANKYSIDEFFKAPEVKDILWNDMFGRFMGYRFRDMVKEKMLVLNEKDKVEYIEQYIKPAIHKRYAEYIFIGFQENFNFDVVKMFNKLGFSCNEEELQSAKINITDQNIGQRGFKSEKPNFQITDEILNSIKELTELDRVLYQEVKRLRGREENQR